jgi:hypothetical protein
MLTAGACDTAGSARQSLADPDWLRKVQLGRGAEVRLCEFANYCEGLDQKQKPVTCQLWDKLEVGPGTKTSVDGKRRLGARPLGRQSECRLQMMRWAKNGTSSVAGSSLTAEAAGSRHFLFGFAQYKIESPRYPPHAREARAAIIKKSANFLISCKPSNRVARI